MKKILSLLALTLVAMADGEDHQAQAAGQQVQAGDHQLKADDQAAEGDKEGDTAEGAEGDEAFQDGEFIIGDQPEQGEQIFDDQPQQQLPQQPLSKQEIEDLYKQYDQDENNLLTKAELLKALTGGQQQYAAQAQAVLMPMLTKHDKNGDGLDRQQFANLANDPDALKKTETEEPEKQKEEQQKEPTESQDDKGKATQPESKETEPVKEETEPAKQETETVEPAKQVLEEL